jgi:hypothetical protein
MSFVWSKAIANLAVLVLATVIGTALCSLVTVGLFDTAHIVALFQSVAVWLALAAMFVCLMVWLSAALDRQAAAAGAGIAVYVALFVLTGFPALRDWTPAGVFTANTALIKGEDVSLARPIAVTLVLAVVFLLLAAWSFRRKEL